jgi:hypothetical protein
MVKVFEKPKILKFYGIGKTKRIALAQIEAKSIAK